MITDGFFALISIVAEILHAILSGIPLVIPPQIGTSFSYFGSYLGYASGYVDIPGVMSAFIFLINFLIAYFTFKSVMWLYHVIFARRAHEKQALPTQNKTT